MTGNDWELIGIGHIDDLLGIPESYRMNNSHEYFAVFQRGSELLLKPKTLVNP